MPNSSADARMCEKIRKMCPRSVRETIWRGRFGRKKSDFMASRTQQRHTKNETHKQMAAAASRRSNKVWRWTNRVQTPHTHSYKRTAEEHKPSTKVRWKGQRTTDAKSGATGGAISGATTQKSSRPCGGQIVEVGLKLTGIKSQRNRLLKMDTFEHTQRFDGWMGRRASKHRRTGAVSNMQCELAARKTGSQAQFERCVCDATTRCGGERWRERVSQMCASVVLYIIRNRQDRDAVGVVFGARSGTIHVAWLFCIFR